MIGSLYSRILIASSLTISFRCIKCKYFTKITEQISLQPKALSTITSLTKPVPIPQAVRHKTAKKLDQIFINPNLTVINTKNPNNH